MKPICVTFISSLNTFDIQRIVQNSVLAQESHDPWVVGSCAPTKFPNEIRERSAPGGRPCAPLGCGLVVTSVSGSLPP